MQFDKVLTIESDNSTVILDGKSQYSFVRYPQISITRFLYSQNIMTEQSEAIAHFPWELLIGIQLCHRLGSLIISKNGGGSFFRMGFSIGPSID
jgi:hypothetical protein